MASKKELELLEPSKDPNNNEDITHRSLSKPGDKLRGVLLVWLLAMTLIVISIGVIMVIYISHLQENVENLQRRNPNIDRPNIAMTTLTSQHSSSSSQSQHGWLRGPSSALVPMDYEPVKHRMFPDGIPLENIAYIYADRKNIDTAVSDGNFTQTPRRGRVISGCEPGGKLMRNEARRAQLCRRETEGQSDTMLLTRNNYRYPYFSTAPWMTDNSNFESVIDRSAIKVTKSGTYIIHSSIHFTDKEDNPGYEVYKEDESENATLVISCMVLQAHLNQQSISTDYVPCRTWQLVSLRADDVIYMKIAQYHWFKIEKSTFFMGLIKLDGDQEPSNS